jgi:peptide/nickel transport system permease protein
VTSLSADPLPPAVIARPLRTHAPGSRKLAAGVAILALLLLGGLLVPRLLGIDPTAQHLDARLLAPSLDHPFGTDNLGRDEFTRCLAAALVDIPLALLGSLIPAAIGSVLGLVSGYGGRLVDAFVMRLGDVLQSLPSYVFLIAVAFIVGPGVGAFLVAAAVISWVIYARLIRSQVLVLRELDYVHAARLSGLGPVRVLVRHVLPNAVPQVIVYLAADMVISLTYLAGLSFLGLGVAEPTPEWGLMIRNGTLYLGTSWWMATFPGLMMVLTGGALAFISDALDERGRV